MGLVEVLGVGFVEVLHLWTLVGCDTMYEIQDKRWDSPIRYSDDITFA